MTPRDERHIAAVAMLQETAVRQLNAWLDIDASDPVGMEAAILDAMANALVSLSVALGRDCPHCVAACLARACKSATHYSQQAQLMRLPAGGSA